MNSNAILITGGTAGIGLATATSLVKQGRHVVITGRNQDKLDSVVAQLGEKVTALLCDSQDLTAVQQLGEQLSQQQVRLDGAVLNAGIFFPNQLETTTLSDFEQTMDVNFKAPFFTLKALLPVLNNPASIVLVSSLVVRKAFPGSSLYTASKMALEGMMGVFNAELASKGIRINSVRPGVTATEIQAKAGMDDAAWQQMEAAMQATPLGRMLTVDDMVPSIEFLLSPQSEGMRSAALDIDAGMGL